MALLTAKEILKVKLTGNYEKDRAFLISESEKMMAEGNREGANAAAELVFEIMPDSEKKKIENYVYINGKRLDTYYNELRALIKENKKDEAREMAKALYEKIISVYQEDEKSKFVSLRNKFEENVYQFLLKPEKVLQIAPFDFVSMISTYGYLLVDCHDFDEAIKVLNKAMEYNEIDCGAKFELAEAYKLMGKNDELLAITKETLKVAASPYAISRCYCNLGFYCFNIGDFDSAAVFYYSSLLFAPHPAVEMELRNIAQRTHKELKPPTEADIDRVFKKYNVQRGPNEVLVSIAAQLANNALENNDTTEALLYLKILFGLTNDPEIEKIILKYEPDAKEKAKARFGIED